MKEDYISLEIAKLLKEKGFDEPCDFLYDEGELKWFFHLFICTGILTNSELSDEIISAPTLQMAMKYLREKHNIIITLDYDEYELADSDEKQVGYGFNIQMADKPTEIFEISNCVFDTYEESCEAAILECLTNLI